MLGGAGGGDLGSGAAALLEAVDGGHGGVGGDGGLRKKKKELGPAEEEKWWIGKSAGNLDFGGEFQISKTDALRTGALIFYKWTLTARHVAVRGWVWSPLGLLGPSSSFLFFFFFFP